MHTQTLISKPQNLNPKPQTPNPQPQTPNPNPISGNTYVLKPSERVPSAAMRLVQLAYQAGVPKGVLNVIHGQHDCVNFICDNPAIKAVSFVGGNAAGEHIYRRAGATGKRVQSNMAAKNHGIILPDATRASVVNAMTGAAFGAAGQRCMALPVGVFVGKSKEWIDDIVSARVLLQQQCV